MLQQKLSQQDQQTVQKLVDADRGSLKRFFEELPPARILETAGEYDAQLLDQGGGFAQFATRKAFGTAGKWLGKAFRPLSEYHGEGYNSFGDVDSPEARLRMDTYIARSSFATGPSFILDYRERNLGMIQWLVGELRMVNRSVLLGMGTFGPRAAKLRKLRRVIPFLLVGPVRPYLGEDAAVSLDQMSIATVGSNNRTTSPSRGLEVDHAMDLSN
ncbi:MAG: hypothetical protein AAFU85_09270 [Planctomycetota bacterium]